jgi:hypothetical protein
LERPKTIGTNPYWPTHTSSVLAKELRQRGSEKTKVKLTVDVVVVIVVVVVVVVIVVVVAAVVVSR